MKTRSNRHLKLLLGEQTNAKISKWKVLLVGAGGIGCQVVKNISRVGFKHITIIDFDTIEQTNLNRQFYFRKQHIGLSKAVVIKQQMKKIVPSLEIVAFSEDLYSKQFNDRFFMQFDIVISALDSIKVREYLAMQATRNGKPLIDAGTMSYNGQAYASLRFKTTCHNCQPSRVDTQTGAACLIRSRPQRPIHCATYAKNFFQSFFTKKGETMTDKLKPERFFSSNFDIQDQYLLQKISQTIFSELFDLGIIDTDIDGMKIDSLRKLKLEEALSSNEIVKNPQSTFKKKQFEKQLESLYEEETLWSLKQYAESFIASFKKLTKRLYLHTLPCQFDKDDQDIMLFVLCITNLRTFNFINWTSPSNQHTFLTYYQCKDLIGRVMPAIASANAIAAALEIREVVNIISNKLDKLRVIHFTNASSERLSPCYQSSPLINCNTCSEKVIYAKVELDIQKITFGQFQEFAQRQLFSFGRDLYSGSFVLIRNSKKTVSQNKGKYLSFVKEMMNENILPLSFRAGAKGTPVIVHISIFHFSGREGIQIIDTPSKRELKLQLLRYFRKVHENNTFMMSADLKFYGGYEF